MADPCNAPALEGRSIINLLSGNKSGALAGLFSHDSPGLTRIITDVSNALALNENDSQLDAMLHTTRALVFESMDDFANMEKDAETAVSQDPGSFHAQVSAINDSKAH